MNSTGVKQTVILTKNQHDLLQFKDFHSHSFNPSDEESVKRIFNTVRTKFGSIDAVVQFTGDYDYNMLFSSYTRQQWDSLVDNFINMPGLITREAVNAMAPERAIEEPVKFKRTKGIVVIVGPDAPVGKKILRYC